MSELSSRRVALLMLAYNQESLVRQSVEACLNQCCEPLDIIFSDDASTDGTYEVISGLVSQYCGPHKVIIRRNAENLGVGQHLNVLIADYPSDFYIASAGDDVSLPNRAAELIQAWDGSAQKVDLISSFCTQMTYSGELGHDIKTGDLQGLTSLDWLVRRPYVIGATHAFTRRLHLHFGPFRNDVIGEDQVMVFRALALGGAITVNKPLVLYRDGGFSRRPDHVNAAENWEWMQRLSRFNLAEARQLVADLGVGSFSEEVRQRCHNKLSSEIFLSNLFASQTLLQMLKIAFHSRDLPLMWRYKKAFTTRYHAPYFAFQSMNKKRRKLFRAFQGR